MTKSQLAFKKNRDIEIDRMVRYKELKERIRGGEFLDREDFLFVRGVDQRFNATRRRSISASYRHHDHGVSGGFNTCSR